MGGRKMLNGLRVGMLCRASSQMSVDVKRSDVGKIVRREMDGIGTGDPVVEFREYGTLHCCWCEIRPVKPKPARLPRVRRGK
jgi:hypothetical protein